MKKAILYLAIILSGGICSLKAQSFDPQTRWIYCQDLFSEGDKCTIEHFENSTMVNDTMKAEYVKQDVRVQVAQFGKEVWIDGKKAYDFGLQPGQNIELQYLNDEYVVATIDSVKILPVFGKSRTVQYATVAGKGVFVFVEGLGTLNHWNENSDLESMTYTFLQDLLWFIVDPPKELNYLDLEARIFGPISTNDCESCSQAVSNKDSELSQLAFQQFPDQNMIAVTGLSEPSIFRVYNVKGQLLQQLQSQQAEVNISTSAFRTGIYYLKVSGKETGKERSFQFVNID